jgi:cytochrome oxidase assembly protein ShyY1
MGISDGGRRWVFCQHLGRTAALSAGRFVHIGRHEVHRNDRVEVAVDDEPRSGAIRTRGVGTRHTRHRDGARDLTGLIECEGGGQLGAPRHPYHHDQPPRDAVSGQLGHQLGERRPVMPETPVGYEPSALRDGDAEAGRRSRAGDLCRAREGDRTLRPPVQAEQDRCVIAASVSLVFMIAAQQPAVPDLVAGNGKRHPDQAVGQLAAAWALGLRLRHAATLRRCRGRTPRDPAVRGPRPRLTRVTGAADSTPDGRTPPTATTRLGRPSQVSALSWYGGSAVVVALIAAMLFLSHWQYERAQPHTDNAMLAASRAMPAVPIENLLGDGRTEVPASAVGRRVVLSGNYLAGKQWLVPRMTGDRDGFLVVTAFHPDRPQVPATVLVARGWVPADGASVPAAGTGTTRLTAWIAAPEALTPGLTGSMPTGQLPDLSAARLVSDVPAPLLDGYLGLVDPPGGLAAAPEPLPAPSTGWSLVNLGYSLQWVLFAIAALWMLIQQLRNARRLPQPERPGPVDAGPTAADAPAEAGQPSGADASG